MNKLPIKNAEIFEAHRFNFGPTPVPELKKQRPDLFSEPTKNDFCQNIYHHLLQRSLIDFLSMIYMASWQTEPLQFSVGSIGFGRYGGVPKGDVPPPRTLLKTGDIERILDGNLFSHIHRWPSIAISLPPNSTVEVHIPHDGTDARSKGEIHIRNRFCTITISTEIGLPVRTIGEYRRMTGLSDLQAYDLATNMYILRAHIHYSRLRSGHPEMKAYKQWATQLVEQIKNQFDEQIIWAQVKEDDMRSRLYPPEHRPYGPIKAQAEREEKPHVKRYAP